MLNLQTTTALVASSLMLFSGSAFAAGAQQSISELPDSGNVMLKGTVKSVDSDNGFTLQDASGETIDIDVSDDQNLQLSEGDHVQVSGKLESEALGLGREIDATRVIRLGSIKNDQASDNYDHVNDRHSKYRTGMVAGETGDENASNREWHGGEYGAIDELPEEGNVTLSGVVEDVDQDDNSFELRDNTGETIDVHTATNVTVREGEQVRVSGVIEDEALGMGEQIVSARVQHLR